MAPQYVKIPEHLSQPIGTSGGRLLEIERSKASFSSDDLKLYLHGEDRLKRIERILPILENEVRFSAASLKGMVFTLMLLDSVGI
jgi:acyl-CoA oxidase